MRYEWSTLNISRQQQKQFWSVYRFSFERFSWFAEQENATEIRAVHSLRANWEMLKETASLLWTFCYHFPLFRFRIFAPRAVKCTWNENDFYRKTPQIAFNFSFLFDVGWSCELPVNNRRIISNRFGSMLCLLNQQKVLVEVHRHRHLIACSCKNVVWPTRTGSRKSDRRTFKSDSVANAASSFATHYGSMMVSEWFEVLLKTFQPRGDESFNKIKISPRNSKKSLKKFP